MSLPARPILRRTAVLTTAVAAVLGTCLVQAVAAPTPRNPLRGIAKLQVQQHAGSSSQIHTFAEDEGDGPHAGEGDSLEVADQADQRAFERSAPAQTVSAQALLAARQQAASMPVASVQLSEITNQPMNAEPAGYDDPFWSNAGAGFRDVSGRATSLAVDGDTG